MKNLFKHIILDEPFEEEKTLPEIEVVKIAEEEKETSKIIWEGRPVNEENIFGENASPSSDGNYVFLWILFIGLIIIFFVCYFSNGSMIFFIGLSIFVFPFFLSQFVEYIFMNQDSYTVTETHVKFNNTFWFTPKEFPISDIMYVQNTTSKYPQTGTISFYLRNKKVLKFKQIKNAHQVYLLLNEAIKKNKKS